ncbi:hypothetical protein ACF0H5_005339 [Mactra antiquata]
MSVANKPVSALLSRFENQADAPVKPVVTPKPGVKPKYGGGPGLNIASAGDRKDATQSNGIKPKVPVNKPNVEPENDAGPKSVGKRWEARVASQTDSDKSKPKPAPKIGAAWQKKIETNKPTDNENNNDTDKVENKNADKPEPQIGKKVPGKLNLESRFGGANIPLPVAMVSPTGPVTKNKPAEANIPKKENQSAGDAKQISPRRKPDTPTGVNLLGGLKSTNTNGPIDFRSKLKPASERRLSKEIGSHHEDVQLRSPANGFGPRVSLKRVSITTVIRTSDGKKFQKMNVKSLDDNTPVPEKPSKVDFDLDLSMLAIDYQGIMEEFDAEDKATHGFTEYEEEELYDDCGNLTETRKKSRVVSLIPTMTEEEEAEWNREGFTGLPEESLPPPPDDFIQEEYDDVAVAVDTSAIKPSDDDDGGELYEYLSENEDDAPPLPGPKSFDTTSVSSAKESPPVPPAPSTITEADKTSNEKISKEQEKERKRKEKEEKELLKKKEKELKKLMKTLKVTPEVLSERVGKGKVKKDAKGKEKTGELALTAGETVDIVRMIDNPRGKWLIRVESSDKYGYCDENNVEIDSNFILNYMKGSKDDKKEVVSAAPEETDQEVYEDVEGANDDLIEDEVYEVSDEITEFRASDLAILQTADEITEFRTSDLAILQTADEITEFRTSDLAILQTADEITEFRTSDLAILQTADEITEFRTSDLAILQTADEITEYRASELAIQLTADKITEYRASELAM